jgi:hypothetical protein
LQTKTPAEIMRAFLFLDASKGGVFHAARSQADLADIDPLRTPQRFRFSDARWRTFLMAVAVAIP